MAKEKLFQSEDFDKESVDETLKKEKLFQSEDFDKVIDKGFWLKYKGWILGIAALLIVVAVVLWCVVGLKVGQKEELDGMVRTTQETHAPNGQEDIPASLSDISGSVQKENLSEHSEESSTPASISEISKTETNPNVGKPTSVKNPISVSSDSEREALNVIRGDYGNVPERRERLGSRYQEIQDRVNEMKRKGVF